MRTLGLAIIVFLGGCGGCGDDSPATDGGSADASFDETIEIPGLSAPVAAFFDANGILHLDCQTDEDCYAAQGYFHAAHRFFQMDLRRRLARGKVSEVVGALGLNIDIEQRLLHSTPDGIPLEQQLLDNADPATRASISAYTRGINAWLADLRAGEHNATSAEERDHAVIDSTVLSDWEDLDSAASVLLLTDILTDTTQDEIELGDALAKLGPDAFNDLFTRRPPSASTIVPGSSAKTAPSRPSIGAKQLALLAKFQPHFEAIRKRLGPAKQFNDKGSNNWAVGPSLAGGKALLANDPHLGMSNPGIWYLNHLDAKTNGTGQIHVAGVSFAGAPGIILGHNEKIAWGVTNTAADFADVYLETLSADDQGVMLNGQKVAFVSVDHTFKVAGDPDEVRTLLFVPHHGPVIDGPNTVDKTAMTVRWTVNDADTDLNFVNGMSVANSVAEARTALENVTTAGQNFVVIDDAGSIGWFPYNRFPTRPWAATYPPYLPLPGTGEAEWGPPVPYANLPQLVDPAQGFIATANNDWTGALADGDLTNDGNEVFQWFIDLGFRHERIVQRITASASHDLASMQSIQADVYSKFGEYVAPEIVTVAGTLTGLSAGAQDIVAALSEWDYQCPTGLAGTDASDSPAVTDADVIKSSAGCTAFHALWPRLRNGIFKDELTAATVARVPYHNATILALTEADPFAGRDYFDDVSTGGTTETKADIVRAALEDTVTYLEVKFPAAGRGGWLWGRLHLLVLEADLFSAFGVITFNSLVFANDGGMNTVDVAAPRDIFLDNYSHKSGASMRLACQAGGSAPIACTIEIPGGQRHHRNDPFYLSLFDKWLNNQPVDFGFSIPAAQLAAQESIRLVAE